MNEAAGQSGHDRADETPGAGARVAPMRRRDLASIRRSLDVAMEDPDSTSSASVRDLLAIEAAAADFLGGAEPRTTVLADTLRSATGRLGEWIDRDAGILAPGDRCGDCLVVRLIGRGGMGEVYEAEDLGLGLGDGRGRRVALKVLRNWRPGLRGRAAEALLRREVATLGRLRHPGIATVHRAGIDESADRPGRSMAYLVMELVDGRPLLEHVAERLAVASPDRHEAAVREQAATDLGLRLAEAVAPRTRPASCTGT